MFFHGEGGPILNCFDRLNDVLLTNSALKSIVLNNKSLEGEALDPSKNF